MNQIVLIFFLMFLSFFFSGSETALTSLPDYKLRKLYIKYGFLRPALTLWILKPYRILISILVGNTVVNLFLSSFVTNFFVTKFLFINREVKEFVIWILTTFVVIIFCELLPKLVSKNFNDKITTFVVLPLSLLQYVTFFIFSPILFFIEKYLIKLQTLHFTKIDEVKYLVRDATKYIFEHKDVLELFERATKFDEVRIKDIYVPKEKVVAINISKKSLTNIIDEVIDSGKTRIPIYYDTFDKIMGYILIKDLFYLCSVSECNISDIIHPIIEVQLNDKAKDVLKKMQNLQTHIAVVKDNNNKFCGIVTMEDILEEIVGDILDEYDIKSSFSK